jgi:ketosteroid isomerase-like protein
LNDDGSDELIEEVRTELNFGAGTTLEGREMIDLIEELLRVRADPEFETVMVPQDGPPLVYDGIEGFREALTDWLTPWEEFRFEVEELIPVGDMLMLLVRQTGTTKHGGVEVTTDSATVWWAPEGRIRRASFYIDRRDAWKAAGLAAPDRPNGD